MSKSEKSYVIGAIFARGGSKGVPGKNIRSLAGEPLIAHAIKTAKEVKSLDRVIVSTDDPEIARVARDYGAEVPFMRPAELATDQTPEWLAWRHAIKTIAELDGGRQPDILVSIPATSPLREAKDVADCLALLLESDADCVFAVTPAHKNPYFNMVVFENGYARLVIAPTGKIARRQDAPEVFDITTAVYALRTEYLMRADSLFEGKVKAIVIPAERALDIDTEFDFKLAEFLVSDTVVR
ncbi:MAG: acylneuraminate cytidylyltransferase family protein [Elusimicrobia bacterium]|nr:acylneuraminate cytidylyltransferase family protein [Elusimicrobiota bacterium]